MNETTDISTMYRLVMGHVRYALSKGWLPVVDMQNYPNPYLSSEKLGQENAWEYYFEQPFHVNVETAYGGENVVLSDGDCVTPYPDYSMNLLQKKNDDLIEWRLLVKMGLMKIEPKLKKEVLKIRNNVFLPGELTLGVLLCGSDSDKRVKGQPIPPPAAFALNTVNEKFKDWECDKVILATDDKTLVEMFKNNFGERCVSLDQIFSVCYDTAQDNSNELNSSVDTVNADFLQGKKHLMQTILLCGCNFFISERCSDATITMFSVKKFGHAIFFNFGNY